MVRLHGSSLSLLSPVGLFHLHAFVNHKFPGIHQHHHEHSAWENVVRRNVASGPKYGEPLYQGPLVKTLGSGSVTGPPAGTSPNGLTCTGLLWSWHHSMKLIAVGAPA